MSLIALKEELDGIREVSWCQGRAPVTERIALALPDGDVGAVDDPRFADWLLEHGEVAPFGEAKVTKIDPNVRHAHRLKARGATTVVGFDPKSILDEIAAVLSPRWQLDAKLHDVVCYPYNGKFERHKDTPRSTDLVGTLIVGLPVAHTGGEFILDTGETERQLDWSGKPDPATVPWVAFYSDVDHEVRPVKSGARVTLVYSLHVTARPRVDPTWEKRRTRIVDAAKHLASQDAWPVMIACAHHVITDDKPQPQPIDTLRGVDRDIADALAEAGYQVAVRACLCAAESEADERSFPDAAYLWSIARLKVPLPPDAIDVHAEVVTFTDGDVTDEEGEDLEACSLGPFILDQVQIAQWVIRERAAATIVHEALFSDSGYFGNEGYEAYIYTLAALEITQRPR